MIGVFLGRQGSGDVSDNFKDEADGERDEPPAAIGDGLTQMGNEEKKEPDCCEYGERKGGRVSVDDDWSVPFSIGIWPVGVNIALDRPCISWVSKQAGIMSMILFRVHTS